MWARASALDRHLVCPAASWLPRDEHGEWRAGYLADNSRFTIPLEDNKEDSIFAEWGTEMHLAKEGSNAAGEEFLARVNPHRDRMWPFEIGQHEVPVKYNCRTGIAIKGPASGGEAWKKLSGPDEVTGTCDWVGRLATEMIWVDDLKTGYQTPDPACNQLKFYAMCFMLMEPKVDKRVFKVMSSVTHWRREWDAPRRIWTTLTYDMLAQFQEELNQAWRHATGSVGLTGPIPIPGPHCNYCPSLEVCSAINGYEYDKVGEDE